jgi:hypothetical protein
MAEYIKFIKANWKLLSIIATAFLSLMLVLYFIMAMFSYLITWYGSFILLFIVLFITSRKIAAFLVFPGH